MDKRQNKKGVFEMKKFLKKDKKGFTLAELLIVVAIIAVLVAISIPIFTSQLEKSRDAVSVANMRTAYAQAATQVLTYTKDGTYEGIEISYDKTTTTYTVKVPNVVLKGQKVDSFSNLQEDASFKITATEPAAGTYTATFTYVPGTNDSTSGTWTLTTLS